MTDLEMVQERINGVESKVNKIDRNVDLMVILLRGNEFDKSDGGMIGDQNELKRRVDRLEKFKDRMFWVLVTAAGITGLNLVQVIDMVIQAIKGHKQ